MSQSSESMAQVLQPFVDKNILTGAVVLAATKDKILGIETAGVADLASKKPMTADSFFWIASMTKPMTAAAFMMLVDEGKVKVDDPVEKYLPEFDFQMIVAEQSPDHLLLKKVTHQITIKELLTHTSGLLFCSHIELPTFDRVELRVAVRSYAMTPLQFKAGTKFGYSNANTNTVGRLIEVISGMSYEDFMDKRLFEPLGMKDTTFWPNEEQLKRLPTVYQPNADKTAQEETKFTQLSYPLNDPDRQPIPGGGLFSTAIDSAKFCQMLLNGGVFEGKRYLSEASVKEMTSRQTLPEVETSYGYFLDTANGNYGHAGACKTDMLVNPKLGLITIFLTQLSGDWLQEEGKDIVPKFRAAAEKLL